MSRYVVGEIKPSKENNSIEFQGFATSKWVVTAIAGLTLIGGATVLRKGKQVVNKMRTKISEKRSINESKKFIELNKNQES